MTNWQRFTLRSLSSQNYPTVITGCCPDNGTPQDKLNWLKIVIGYAPELPKDLQDEGKWPLLPEGISREQAGQVLDHPKRLQISKEVADVWTTDDLIERAIQQISQTVSSRPGGHDKIRLVFPHTPKPGPTSNLIPQAFAETLLRKLGQKQLPLPIMLETDINNPDPNNGIYILGKAGRGVPKDVEFDNDSQKRFYYGIQKIARQILIGGKVDKNAVYWLLDDCVTAGGTLSNYYADIVQRGGTVGAITTLSQHFHGNEVLAPRPETMEFLEFAMWKKIKNEHQADNKKLADDLRAGRVWINGFTADDYEKDTSFPAGTLEILKKRVCFTLSAIGVFLEYGDFYPRPAHDFGRSLNAWGEQTSMTNQELLLLGAYFMDPSDEETRNMLNRALNVIGTTIEAAKDSYVVRVANLPSGNSPEFSELVDYALQAREHYKISSGYRIGIPTLWSTHTSQTFVEGINGTSIPPKGRK